MRVNNLPKVAKGNSGTSWEFNQVLDGGVEYINLPDKRQDGVNMSNLPRNQKPKITELTT